MVAFEAVHAGWVAGSLTMYDRLIFKRHLTALFKQDSSLPVVPGGGTEGLHS
jgi:hypothetical protein